MILFTCRIGLKWVGGGMGRGSDEGYWWGHGGEGYWWGHGVRVIVKERGEEHWGCSADRWRKKTHSHLTSLLGPSMGPRVSKVMKSKLQRRIA